MCRWTEYKALVELLQLSKPVGNKSQQKLIFALEGNRSDLLQTEEMMRKEVTISASSSEQSGSMRTLSSSTDTSQS